MRAFLSDLGHAWRACRRTPLFFAGVVATLAIGIGANGAAFSILRTVLFQPLPYRSPERLVMVWDAYNRPDNWRGSTTSTVIAAWHDQSADVFDDVATLKLWQGNLEAQLDLVLPDRAERLNGALVSPNFFEILGVSAMRGRLFSTADDLSGTRDVVVLSHAVWQRNFGSSDDIVGRTISLAPGRSTARPFLVLGVLPAAFRFTYPNETEVWVMQPWTSVRADGGGRAIVFNGSVARLKKGVSLESAQQRMAALNLHPSQEKWPAASRQITRLESLDAWVIGTTKPSLILLGGVAALLFLITCATVANALFVRNSGRKHELAVRSALGAGRWALVRLQLAEGIVLSLVGAAAGCTVAALIQPILRAIIPAAVPRANEMGADLWMLGFGAAIAIMTIALAVALPAWRSGRVDVIGAMKRASKTTSADRRMTLWRQGVITVQAGISTALLVSATLLLISFWRLNQVPLGFDGDKVLTVEMRLTQPKFRQPGAIPAFQDDLVERVAALPGVLEVGLSSAVPFRGTDFLYMLDRPEAPGKRKPANARFVDSAFFSIMRLPLLAGRLFDKTDTTTSTKVIVVSKAYANSLFGDADPVGRLIDADQPTSIIGVVGDARYVAMDKEAAPAVYYPRSQRPSELICLVARTSSDASTMAPSIRKAVAELDSAVPMMNLTTVDAIVSESVSGKRFLTTTTATFAGIALLLTLAGLGAVVARGVVERHREMAIRAALGASTRRLFVLIATQGLLPVGLGVAVGLMAVWWSASILAQFLFQVAPHEPLPYAAVALVVLGISASTCLIAGHRVRSIAPASALRAE